MTKIRTNTSNPRVIDLFSGCGGLSLGLYQAGWEGLFATEKETFETRIINTSISLKLRENTQQVTKHTNLKCHYIRIPNAIPLFVQNWLEKAKTNMLNNDK